MTAKTRKPGQGREAKRAQKGGAGCVCGVCLEPLTDSELDALTRAAIAETGRRLDLSAELEDGAELSADALAVELDLTADERGPLE